MAAIRAEGAGEWAGCWVWGRGHVTGALHGALKAEEEFLR